MTSTKAPVAKAHSIKAVEFFETVVKVANTDTINENIVKTVFTAMESVIVNELKTNGTLKIPGVGKVTLKVKPAGTYPIPFAKNGETKTQPERRKLRFVAAKSIREQFETKKQK